MASCGQAPEPSDPVRKRERVAELLGCGADRDALLAAVDAGASSSVYRWRRCVCSERGGDRPLLRFTARNVSLTFPPNCTACRAPTFSFCRFWKPGSPDR
jgi:hypothetical protein